ncbi:hypothetical protein [Kerstersia sp.]|uniref:hypothetical protein n=1 Tax=Kerstersia sp. TaxID=1930783 RepID=UPI003F9138C5
MRIFDLYLRRAGLAGAATRTQHRSMQRLMLDCDASRLGDLRRQICLDLRDAGLEVSALRVGPGVVDGSVHAYLDVDCPPERRAAMMCQVRRLREHPGVRRLDVDAAVAASA